MRIHGKVCCELQMFRSMMQTTLSVEDWTMGPECLSCAASQPLCDLKFGITAALLFCRQKANAGVLTNFEVLDFLRSRGAKVDPMGCLGAVAASECKVITLLLFYLVLYHFDLFIFAILCLNWSYSLHHLIRCMSTC